VGLDGRETAKLILIIGIANIVARVVIGFVADMRCVSRLAIFSVNLVICGLASTFVVHYVSFFLLAAYAAVFGVGIGQYSKIIYSPKSRGMYNDNIN